LRQAGSRQAGSEAPLPPGTPEIVSKLTIDRDRDPDRDRDRDPDPDRDRDRDRDRDPDLDRDYTSGASNSPTSRWTWKS
jgi:hypothetical protein